jgi:hypothetical protein
MDQRSLFSGTFILLALPLGGLFLVSIQCGTNPTAPPGQGSGSSSGASGSGSTGASTGATSGRAGSGASSGIAGTGVAGTGGGTISSGGDAGAGNAIDMTVSVLERNKHPSRDGNFFQPTLTKAKVGAMALDAAFNATFTGNMWASPLYLDKGPGGKGVFFAVTTGNDVYALDETDGHDVWGGPHRIGNPAPSNGPTTGCGNIHPLGILSTPVIDPTLGPDGFATIYVAGAVGQQSIDRHEVHALSVKDGSERRGWPVNVSAVQAAASAAAGITDFHASGSNQRSALSLVNGILYVAYGGHVGDCDTYHGWVVAIDTHDPTKTGGWVTGGRGEAIWAAAGMASDGNGVIAITSNRNGNPDPHLDSEEVVRITGMAVLNRSNANIFYPSNWRNLDGADLDFGSNSPVLFQVGGVSYVAALTKNGDFYLLNGTNFGGTDPGTFVPPGGAYLQVAMPGMSVKTAPAAYTSPTGVHVTFTANAAHGCPSGGGTSVMSVLVPPGAPPVPRVSWCAPTSSQTAPIATTSDGKADAIVWFMNGGNLVGVDGDTGMPAATVTGGCSNVRQWTSPIAVKGRIIVGGDGHLCSWSPH